jgi:hypothetical protein
MSMLRLLLVKLRIKLEMDSNLLSKLQMLMLMNYELLGNLNFLINILQS